MRTSDIFAGGVLAWLAASGVALHVPAGRVIGARAVVPCSPLPRRALAPVAQQGRELYSDYPDGDSRGSGLVVSAGGLFATLIASATALSGAGSIATIAASAAGLFTFKLSKELNQRGIDSAVMSRAATDAGTKGVRMGVGLLYRAAALVVYCLASIVSFIGFLLMKLGDAVSTLGMMTTSMKARIEGSIADGYPISGDELQGTDASMLGKSLRELNAPPPLRELNARLPPPRSARSPPGGMAPPARPPTMAEEIELGRRLAVEQMLERSATAAAATRAVESERSQVLKQRQEEAVRRVFASRREAQAKASAKPTPPAPTRLPPPVKPQPRPSSSSQYFDFKAPGGSAGSSSVLPPPMPPSPPRSPPPSAAANMNPSLADRMKKAQQPSSYLPPTPKGGSAKLDVSLASAAARRTAPPPTASPYRPPARSPPAATPAPPAAPPSSPSTKPSASQWLPKGVSFDSDSN